MAEIYTINMEDLPESFTYKPCQTLEVDCTPITGSQLEEWRKSLWRTVEESRTQKTWSGEFPSAPELSRRMGVPEKLYKNWEMYCDPTPFWSALIREWYLDRIEIEMESAPRSYVKAIIEVVGGIKELSKICQVRYGLIASYSSRGAPLKGGAGPFFRFLFNDLGLDPVKRNLKTVIDAKLTDSQVRHIRNRYRLGDKATDLAQEFGLSRSSLYDLLRNDSYTWVK